MGRFVTTLALVWLIAGSASADRVVLHPAGGQASQERLDDVDEALARAVAALRHEVLTPPAGGRDPVTSAQFRSEAEAQHATYVVVADVTPLLGQYRLKLRVGYAPESRVEELEVNVVAAEEDARLVDVLGSMLRASGLGDDALRLTGQDATPGGNDERARRDAAERERRDAAERARRAREAQARQEFLERERQRAAQERAREEAAWEARPRYGTDAPWIALLGADVSVLAAYPTQADGRGGGALVSLALRAGRVVPGVTGLEVRGGIDVIGGSVTGLGLVVGGAWLGSPFLEPVFVGGAIELGLFQGFTGAQPTALLLRGGPTVSWRATERLHLEATIPEIMGLTSGSGVMSIGAAVKVGYRF